MIGLSRSRLPARHRAALAARFTPVPRVLGWAEHPSGVAVGTPVELLVQRGEEWQRIGWHEIETAGYEGLDHQLRWTVTGGSPQSLRLVTPHGLPELVTERVEATILVVRQVPVEGTPHGLTVTGRRRLDGSTDLFWQVHLHRGTSARTPGVGEAADRAIAALRSEYDFPR